MAKKTQVRRNRRSSNEFSDLPSMESERSETRGSRSRGSSRSSRGGEQSDLSGMIREIISNPTVRYVAGGIATAMLAKLATKMSDRYPELSNFIRENLDTFEGRLADTRSGLSESQRH